MGDKLTPKEEAFSLKFVECNNASEAYRHAYDVGENTKPETVWKSAWKTLAKPHVNRRVIELQEAVVERTMVTIESITKELEEARDVAKDEKQGAAMTGASMGKAKLHGLLIDKAETKLEVKHDFDGASEKLSALLTARDARK